MIVDIGYFKTIKILSTIYFGKQNFWFWFIVLILTANFCFQESIILTESYSFSVFPAVCSGGSFQIKNIYDKTEVEPGHESYAGGWGADSGPGLAHVMQPQFMVRDSSNVSAILGKPAILNCRVRAVGNRTVSIFLQFLYFTPRNILNSGVLDKTSGYSFANSWEVYVYFRWEVQSCSQGKNFCLFCYFPFVWL